MRLTELNTPITDFTGKPIATTGGEGESFTVRTGLLNCLGTMKASDGKEAIQAFTVGSLISQAGEHCEIKAEQFALLKKAVEANTPQYVILVLGQLLLYLESQDAAVIQDGGG